MVYGVHSKQDRYCSRLDHFSIICVVCCRGWDQEACAVEALCNRHIRYLGGYLWQHKYCDGSKCECQARDLCSQSIIQLFSIRGNTQDPVMAFSFIKLLTSVSLALLCTSGAVAAPWPSSVSHETRRTRLVGRDSTLKLDTFHPSSTFEVCTYVCLSLVVVTDGLHGLVAVIDVRCGRLGSPIGRSR